jgi:hypothetical protein
MEPPFPLIPISYRFLLAVTAASFLHNEQGSTTGITC